MSITSHKTIIIILVSLLWLVLGITTAFATSLSNDAPDAIKIGVNLELTGRLAYFGRSTLTGMKLAISEINANGGVLGHPLQLVIADNHSEPIEGANAMDRLATVEKVSVVIGPMANSISLAVASVAEHYQIPFVSTTSTNPQVTISNGIVRTYAFRSCFADSFQGTVMANFSYRTLGARTAAIYIDNTSDYSKNIAKTFEEQFLRNGGQIVAIEAYFPGDTDFTTPLANVTLTKPDVIFIPGYYQEVGKIIRQARDMGIQAPLLGTDSWDSSKLVTFAGADALNNTFFSSQYSADDPDLQSRRFVNSYRSEYGDIPDVFPALGYDAVYMLADAIKRTGSTDGTQIASALAQTRNLRGITGTLTVDNNHNPIKSAVVIRLIDGTQTFFQRIEP